MTTLTKRIVVLLFVTALLAIVNTSQSMIHQFAMVARRRGMLAHRSLVRTTFVSGRDFVAHPLARLVEPVLRRFVGLREAAFDAVPGGLGGVPGVLQLLVQLGRLFAQRLKFGFGFGFDGVAGFFDFGRELVQIAVDLGQLAPHFFGEFSLLCIGIILLFQILRCFGGLFLELVELLRGGSLFIAAHRESGGPEEAEE